MQRFFKSFFYASQGFLIGFEERNMKVHLLLSILVCLLGWYFQISSTEWLCIIFSIGFVIMAELFNTAIEYLCDAVKPLHSDLHRAMGKPKDVSAAAVLTAAMTALLVGLIIFVPKLLPLVQM